MWRSAMGFSAARLTCYALLSAIEEDLRDVLVAATRGEAPSDVLHSTSHANAIERYLRDEGDRADPADLSRLLPYVDFADLVAAVNRYRTRLDERRASAIKGRASQFAELIPIRNRVAHTRPLNLGDLASLLDTAEALLTECSVLWPSLGDTRRRLQADPSYVLTLEIRFPNVDAPSKRHNLPLPDFDETGLLGRRNDQRRLLEMLRGAYPVISIVGDGGVGKTALALKVAYELVDDKEIPFDVVVWTTAKSRQLTSHEIVRIEGAIQDSLGMLSSAAEQLGGIVAKENPIEEVLTYMRTFKVLLVLDNLETVLDTRLREFLTQLPPGSKVLITSRIGLGALENPLKLSALQPRDALELLRASARAKGVQSLVRLPEEVLARFVSRMKAHPLYIKWFVSAVQAGRRPEEVLADSATILDYCMSNVYEYLEPDSRQILRTLQTLAGLHSQAELADLNRMDSDCVQRAVAELITTNFVNWQSVPAGGGISTEYEVTEFAQAYLDRHHPVGEEKRRDLVKRRESLLSQGRRLADAHAADPFAPTTIEIRGQGDFSVAGILVRALNLKERGEIQAALDLVHEGQALAPDYHECYRIEALIYDSIGDIGRARQSLETAIEQGGESAPLLFFAGKFCLTRAGEPDRGLRLMQKAANLRPDDLFLHLEVAAAQMRVGHPGTGAEIAGRVVLDEGARPDLRQRAARLMLKAYVLQIDRAIQSRDWDVAVEHVEELNLRLPSFADRLDPVAFRRVIKCAELADVCALRTSDSYLARRASELAGSLRGVIPSERPSERYGTIKRLRHDLSFGFLAIPGQDRELFFHSSAVRPQGQFFSLEQGDEVVFREGIDPQGRPKATDVSLLDDEA